MPPAPDGGYALLWRKFLEHPYWTEKRTFSRAEAWMDCWFGMAAYDDHERIVGGNTVQLKRSQFIASERFLERRWKWSRGKVRRFLTGAIESGELVRVGEVNGGCSGIGTSNGTIYAVANYDVYQPRGTTNGTSDGPPAVPVTDQRETRESKGNKKNPPKAPQGEYTEEFDAMWREYPVRAGGNSKTEAFKRWRARLKEGVSVAEMTAGVKRYAAFCFATGKLRTEYVKQASSFLGTGRHYRERWDIPDDGPRGGAVGSEARAVTNERPQESTARVGRMTSTDGRDPEAEARAKERAAAAAIAGWEKSHPQDARNLMLEIVHTMQQEPEWAGVDEQFVKVAAFGKYNARVLELCRGVA